jgi:hypothetical protein
MNPKYHCGGPNIVVMKNEVDGDVVRHLCFCSKCDVSFVIEQTVEQWKRD